MCVLLLTVPTVTHTKILDVLLVNVEHCSCADFDTNKCEIF